MGSTPTRRIARHFMPQDLLQIALEHHRAGRLRQAEAGYRALLATSPDDADALHWLGVLLYQAGAMIEAVPLIERAVQLRPTDPAFQHNLAQAYLGSGRPDAAVAAFERAAAFDPTRAQTLVGLGTALLAKGATPNGPAPETAAAAADAFRRAQGAGLDTAESHLDLGVALLLAGQTDEAIAALRAALARNARYASAHYHLASAYRQKREPKEVRKSLLKALEIEPGLARAWHDLAVLDAEAGNPAIAAGLFRKAIAAKNNFAAAWVGLAKVLDQQGRRDEAAAAAARAAELAHAALAARVSQTTGASSATADSVAELERKLLGKTANDLHFALAARMNVFTPSQLPSAPLKDLFDRYAETFDHDLVDSLQYRAPDFIAQAVDAVRSADPHWAGRKMDVLDLGCGTGLCGVHLHHLATTLTGVDMSPNMIEKSRERGIYDRLELGDIVDFLNKSPRSFDLVVSADVFIYVGDLAPTFEAASRSLRPGGLLAFSAEAGGGDRFNLGMATRRYTHSEPYIRRMAAVCGFEVASLLTAPLRVERHEPVPGYVVVLRLLPE